VATPATGTLSSEQVTAEVVAASKRAKVDPLAVLAVIPHEGGFAVAPGHYDPDQLGNPGWSYGPFQMRSPGALPITSAGAQGPGEAYAWSKQGIDYAVSNIGQYAAGLTGKDAVTAIVTKFEKSANQPAEIAASWKTYQQMVSVGSSPGLVSLGPGGTPATGPGGVTGAVEGGAAAVKGAATSVWDGLSSVQKALGFLFSYRGLEVIGGGLLLLLGLYLLARTLGVSAPKLPAIVVPPPAVEQNLSPQPVYSTHAKRPKTRATPSSGGGFGEVPF